MTVQQVNEVAEPRYPEVRTRLRPALWRKLSRLAEALGTNPPGAVRILVAQANAPSVSFDATTAENSEDASACKQMASPCTRPNQPLKSKPPTAVNSKRRTSRNQVTS